jgi:hypothetical protein
MKRTPKLGLPALILILAACAADSEKESVLARNDAIDDYIEVAELKEIDQIRIKRQLNHKVITDRYIILYDDRAPYLATFRRRCHELYELEVTPDRVYDSRSLRARFDTYRGCIIQSLYEVTTGQAQELLDLGQKAAQ